MVKRWSIFVGFLTCFALAHAALFAQINTADFAQPATLEHFELHVRPVLATTCAKCHGSQKASGGLRVDSREALLAGGEHGPALISGQADNSLLVQAIRHTHDEVAMPPDEELPAEAIEHIAQWIDQGAPWPAHRDTDIDPFAAAGHWAFQPLATVDPPHDSDPSKSPSGQLHHARHPIDAFLVAQLGKQGLAMSPPATPREQVRRAYFDLWGLPPSPEAVAAFEQQPTNAKWEQLIDMLLASPHYGERWGRHWLDVVRYAESNGYERDGEKPNAWRYRDYVIDSFNDDKSYDQFVREQLAGDELVEHAAADPSNRQWRDSIVATGFYRLHIWDDEPDSSLAAEFDDLDDVMVTTGTAFLGLTLGCARCHDHKFDPISQTEYYSLLSFFRGIDPYGKHISGGGGRGTGRIQRLLANPADVERWKDDLSRQVKELEQRLAQSAGEDAKKTIEAELKLVRETAPPFDSALAVAEIGPTTPATHVLYRGDVNSPREIVAPAFPVALGLPSPQLPIRPADAMSSGLRRLLADWVASPNNPLTARVMANRLWQHHFGVGLVPTPDDFGHSGLPPTNQPLLDYLATKFMATGWKLKAMHRLIMTSHAYRQSSRTDNPQAFKVDPENTLFWRQNLRRVEGEVVRDTMLSVSGMLNPKQGGPSVFPTLPQEIHSGQDSSGKGWQDSPAGEQNRRSVYLVVKRGLKIPLLDSFDFANSTSPTGVRPVTTTAPQALMLLNDSFVQSQAEALASRVTQESGSEIQAGATRAFQLVTQRDPVPAERQALELFLLNQRQLFVTEGHADPERKALASLCRGLLNINEMLYVD